MRGFTLIEIIIYSAIVTAILSFALLSLYQIISFDERGVAQQELIENKKFLLEKIYWVLQSVEAINSPAVGGSGGTLSVNKLNYGFNPLIVSLNNGVTQLVSGATATPLTNSRVTIDSLNFEHLTFSGGAAIKINALLSNSVGSTSLETTIIVK